MSSIGPPVTGKGLVESPGELSEEKGSLTQQKDRTISIEEPVPRASVDEQEPWSVTSTSNAAVRRVPSARRRGVIPPPLVPSNSTRSRNSTRETPLPPNTATSTRSNRQFTLRSMGVIKDIKDEGGHGWKEPTVRESLIAIYKASWLNVLIVFVPISWALHFALDKTKSSSDTVIFITAFVAIIPLAKLLAWGTEELALRVGQTLGGLLNATFGNVVELIVGVIALAQCKLNVVQSSLVGSILSNLLLVLGMCFFAGGTRFVEQGFIQTTAQLNTSLLILSVTAILIPAAFHVAVQNANSESNGNVDPNQEQDILHMSHGVAIILLVIYGASLIFQLWSHAHLYADEGEYAPMKSRKYPKSPPRDPNHPSKLERTRKALHLHRKKKGAKGAGDSDSVGSSTATAEGSPTVTARTNTGFTATTATVENGKVLTPVDENAEVIQGHGDVGDANTGADLEAGADAHSESGESEKEEETPQLTAGVAFGLLAVVTVIVAVTAEFLVSSIDGLTSTGHISEEWVGLILLPIVGNAAEHVTAVTVSYKDKLDLSIGVAVGSSIQIALFVIPVLVLLGWIMGKPLTMLFDPFESIVLFLSVLTVAFVINDGRSNWLEGMILMSLYVILGTAFWFYPANTSINC